PDPFTTGKNGGDNLAAANLVNDVNIPSSSWTKFVGQQFDSKSLLHVLAQELSGQQQIPCLGPCEGENGVASTRPSRGADQSAVGAINRPLRGFAAHMGYPDSLGQVTGSGTPYVV